MKLKPYKKFCTRQKKENIIKKNSYLQHSDLKMALFHVNKQPSSVNHIIKFLLLGIQAFWNHT